jgi:hypothetical protein
LKAQKEKEKVDKLGSQKMTTIEGINNENLLQSQGKGVKLFPPMNFATVEENFYRSSLPSPINYPVRLISFFIRC